MEGATITGSLTERCLLCLILPGDGRAFKHPGSLIQDAPGREKGYLKPGDDEA